MHSSDLLSLNDYIDFVSDRKLERELSFGADPRFGGKEVRLMRIVAYNLMTLVGEEEYSKCVNRARAEYRAPTIGSTRFVTPVDQTDVVELTERRYDEARGTDFADCEELFDAYDDEDFYCEVQVFKPTLAERDRTAVETPPYDHSTRALARVKRERVVRGYASVGGERYVVNRERRSVDGQRTPEVADREPIYEWVSYYVSSRAQRHAKSEAERNRSNETRGPNPPAVVTANRRLDADNGIVSHVLGEMRRRLGGFGK